MYENSKIPSRMSYDLLIHELNRQERTLGACNVYGAALVRGVVPHKKPRRWEKCFMVVVYAMPLRYWAWKFLFLPILQWWYYLPSIINEKCHTNLTQNMEMIQQQSQYDPFHSEMLFCLAMPGRKGTLSLLQKELCPMRFLRWWIHVYYRTNSNKIWQATLLLSKPDRQKNSKSKTHALLMYCPVLVSTNISAPMLTNNGTLTTAPVSRVAGFVPPVTRNSFLKC